jgi:hypothetical protein
MDRWLAMEAFVRVVESGTFVGAAERLGMSPISNSTWVHGCSIARRGACR